MPDKAQIAAAHERHWTGTLTLFALMSPGFAGLGLLAFVHEPWWLIAATILIVSYVFHTSILSFHEASHGSLCPNRFVNDALGIFVGTLGLMSLSLYRAAHHTHHAHLGTERDEELWPFVATDSPRWFRLVMAFAELNFGLFYTPLLFLRSFLRPGTPITNSATRRRIWAELIGMAIFWGTLLGGVALFNLWYWFSVMWLIPAFLAGNLQSWRKYIEHMGMTGTTALGCTRSIHTPTFLGRLISFSLLNEPYHGVHHLYAKLPLSVLPSFAGLLTPRRPGDTNPFPNYTSAVWDMILGLNNPRIGAHWLNDVPAPPKESAPFAKAG